MKDAPDVLARTVIPEGKVFIKAGEENSRAYFIQKGRIRAFVMEGDEKIEVATYGPGTLIGEISLMLDEPLQMNYEAVVSTTVAITTRQDFKKKLSRADSMIRNTLNQIMFKLSNHDTDAIKKARDNLNVDDKTVQLIRSLTDGLPKERRGEYEKIMLPHLNALLKVVKDIKDKERHIKQNAALEQRISQIESEEE